MDSWITYTHTHAHTLTHTKPSLLLTNQHEEKQSATKNDLRNLLRGSKSNLIHFGKWTHVHAHTHVFCLFSRSLPFFHSVPVFQFANSWLYCSTLHSWLLHLLAFSTGGQSLWVQINQKLEEPDSPKTWFKNTR